MEVATAEFPSRTYSNPGVFRHAPTPFGVPVHTYKNHETNTMKRTVLKTIAAAVAMGALGTLSLSPAAYAQEKGSIGISMPTKSSARWIADGDNMVKVL